MLKSNLVRMNLVIILCNYVLAQGAMAWVDRKWATAESAPIDMKSTQRWLLGAGAVLNVWVTLSLAMLNSIADMPKVRVVASVGPNFPLPAFQDE